MLPPNTLWPLTLAATHHGLACGALQPIATDSEIIQDQGMNFVVRIAANVARKQQAAAARTATLGKDFNPFLPYDKDLFVANLSPTHVCILNKFNVVDHHLLMVTRTFEDQETGLTAQDFEAMWLTLREVDGLVFYNGGPIAGASQKHKHLQCIPWPLAEQPAAPVDVGPALPFVHGWLPLDPTWANHPTEAGVKTLGLYGQLLSSLALKPENTPENTPEKNLENTPLKPAAYNLLATRHWLLVVPRLAERSQGISINALGFAGSLFVKDREQLETLKAVGPMAILKAVAVP